MTDKDKREKRDGSYFAPGRRRQRKMLMIIVPAVAAVIALAVVGSIVYKPIPVEAIDGIECNTVETLNYHVHAHLDVFVNGNNVTVPAGIGIPGNKCFFWLHTHTTDGVIHMESPRQMNFTLGQFMDIWSQTKPDTSFFGALSNGPVNVYVGGAKHEGDYKSIQLNSKEEIAIVIGQSPKTIPDLYPTSAPPS